MLALILTLKFLPIIIASSSRWLILAGMIARPAAISSRTNSGVIRGEMRAERLTAMLQEERTVSRIF
jgi:hypothetical protein